MDNKLKYVFTIVVFGLGLAACMQNVMDTNFENDSTPFSYSESGVTPVPEIVDGKTAEIYAKKMGYYNEAQCASYLKGGENIWYSGSYGLGGEAGQARGTVTKKNLNGVDRFFFVQESMVTVQALFPPGLGQLQGESRWDIGRYQRLLADIAFGRFAIQGPLYQSVKGEIVSSLTGGTANGQVQYGKALKLTLNNPSTQTNTMIVFVENQGPRIMEFTEGGSVGGTAKVYISASK